MQLPIPTETAAPPAVQTPSPLDLLKARLAKADLGSLADTMADALDRLDLLKREAAPHMLVVDACKATIFERLQSENRTQLNHASLDIRIDTDKDVVVDEIALREFLSFKIDGEPIPQEMLKKAVWEETIPATTVLKKHMTHVKKLLATYGDAIRPLYNRAFHEVQKQRLVVQLKPKP